MMTLDPDDQFFQEDDSHSPDDDIKNTKDNQLYKDTMTLLKRKMCTAQDLLKQFNEKAKEYKGLDLELRELKIDKEKLFNKYNTASEKLTRLELSIRDSEKSRDECKYIADKQKVELDEKKKHIEQLEFKIKEMEKDSFHLKDEVKKLQQENKISKSIAKKATKDKASLTTRINQHDVSVNTDFKKVSPRKPQMSDKILMTDDDVTPFPVLCTKCEKRAEFPRLGEILKIMSSPPPPSLSNQFSPPSSPRSMPSCSQQSESITSNTFKQYYHENPYSSSYDKKTIEKSRKIHEEPDKPSFMLLHQLNRRVKNLEKQIKKEKRKQRKNSDCHHCSSKNIKFIVQLPNEEKYSEYAKRSRHKQKNVKRLNKRQIKLKHNKKSKVKEWQVDSDIEIQNVKLSSQHNTDHAEKKCKTFEDNDVTDLFRSPVVLVPSLTPKTQANVDSCESETMQTTHTESLSTLDVNTDEVFVNSTDKDIVCDDENKNECNDEDKNECNTNMQSSVSNPVLVQPSYPENIVKQANQRMDCISEKVFQTTDSEHNLSLDVLKKVNSDKTFDLISENLNNTNLSTIESDKSEIVVTKNDDIVCKNIEEEIIDQTVVLETKSKLKSQENWEETQSMLLDIRRISISSTSSSEYDELFSTSTICTLPDKESQLDIAKHESEQNITQEVENAKETNILESNNEINSSAIEKIEVINSLDSHSGQTENLVEKQMNAEEEIRESKEENEQSSDDSLNLKCRIAKSKKRGKCSNVIESDESSEETPRAIINSKNRKKSIAAKKRIISKINRLKKTSNYPITPKQTGKVSDSQSDITDTYIPTKKQRIAHIPKDNSEIKEVISAGQSSQIVKDTNEIQKVESENLSSKPKLVNKRVKKTTDDSLQKTKKLKLMRKPQSRQNYDKQPATLDTTKLEPTLTSTESLELIDKDEDHQTKIEIDITENKQDENNHQEKVKDDTTGETSGFDLLPSQTITEMTECTEDCVNIEPSNIMKEENTQNEESLDESKQDFGMISEDDEMVPARNLRDRKAAPKTPDRRISRRIQDNSPSVVKRDADTSKCPTDIAPTPSNNKKPKKKNRTKPNKNQSNLPFDSTNSSLGDTIIVSYFNDFFFGVNQDKEENFEHLRKNEKFIREQLSILIETEPLTTDGLLQVIDNLLNISPLEVIALVLVEYASTEYLDDVKCNTMYTPPAPPMTKFEQKLVTLITTIKISQPEFMDAVEKGLQYKLFRLGKPLEIHIVERLFRILIVLNKIKKDREKVRMLLCDALYCYNIRAMNIIYIALSCWSEVFPKQDSNDDILVKTMVHIVMSANVNRPYSKLMPLKRLLTDYYGYPNCGYRAENFKLELIDKLKENVPCVNTAIILLCKSKGADWALEYIVRDLKRMIISQVHPSMYDILTLLGDVLRPFSSDNLKSALQEITDQLCEVLTANSGSHDVQEGIVSCLLNIGGKFSFSRDKIAKCVFSWQSNQELRQTTKEKLKSFLKTHNFGWWRKFIQQNFPVVE